MLEIGLHGENIKYQKLINPLQKYDTGEDIIKNLIDMDQDPDKTIHFWTLNLHSKASNKMS